MKLRETIDNVLGKTLVVIMAVMVVNVLWQVFTRFIIGTPSSFTDELARYLMIWIGVLGAAYVSGRNMHVAIDILLSKASGATQKKIHWLVYIIIIIFSFLALVVGGFRLVYISYLLGQTSAALQIPMALVYLVIPISGILIIFYKTSDLLKL